MEERGHNRGSVHFTYDASGNLLTQQDDFKLADGRGDWGQRSHYNALGYMTWFKRGRLFNGQVTDPSGASGRWTLDAWGNRLGPSATFASPPRKESGIAPRKLAKGECDVNWHIN